MVNSECLGGSLVEVVAELLLEVARVLLNGWVLSGEDLAEVLGQVGVSLLILEMVEDEDENNPKD